MRLEAGRPGPEVSEVTIFLTRAEAQEMSDALRDMLDQAVPDAEWHAHISSTGFQTEIILAWDDAPGST